MFRFKEPSSENTLYKNKQGKVIKFVTCPKHDVYYTFSNTQNSKIWGDMS